MHAPCGQAAKGSLAYQSTESLREDSSRAAGLFGKRLRCPAAFRCSAHVRDGTPYKRVHDAAHPADGIVKVRGKIRAERLAV